MSSAATPSFFSVRSEHGHGARRADPPELAQLADLAFAFPADQEVHDRALALEQFLDETLADEAGRPGDEILHDAPLASLCCWRVRAILPKSEAAMIAHKPGDGWSPLPSGLGGRP